MGAILRRTGGFKTLLLEFSAAMFGAQVICTGGAWGAPVCE